MNGSGKSLIENIHHVLLCQLDAIAYFNGFFCLIVLFIMDIIGGLISVTLVIISTILSYMFCLIYKSKQKLCGSDYEEGLLMARIILFIIQSVSFVTILLVSLLIPEQMQLSDPGVSQMFWSKVVGLVGFILVFVATFPASLARIVRIGF